MNEERKEYLKELSEDYGVDLNTVFSLASIRGENEDYDGLISALEDIESSEEY